MPGDGFAVALQARSAVSPSHDRDARRFIANWISSMTRLVLSFMLGEASQRVPPPKASNTGPAPAAALRPTRHLSILCDYKNNPLHFRSRDREVAMSSPTKKREGIPVGLLIVILGTVGVIGLVGIGLWSSQRHDQTFDIPGERGVASQRQALAPRVSRK